MRYLPEAEPQERGKRGAYPWKRAPRPRWLISDPFSGAYGGGTRPGRGVFERRRRRSGRPCKNPPVRGRHCCRMYGGTSPGAPKGNRNAWKHGFYSAEAIAQRREVRALLRELREGLEEVRELSESPATDPEGASSARELWLGPLGGAAWDLGPPWERRNRAYRPRVPLFGSPRGSPAEPRRARREAGRVRGAVRSATGRPGHD